MPVFNRDQLTAMRSLFRSWQDAGGVPGEKVKELLRVVDSLEADLNRETAPAVALIKFHEFL